jgi:outer membrane protein assembly factor BamB
MTDNRKNPIGTTAIPASVAMVLTAAVALWAYPFAPPSLQGYYPSFVRDYYTPGSGPISERAGGPKVVVLPTRETVETKGTLETFDGKPAKDSFGFWLWFRGQDFSNVAPGGLELIKKFGPNGPPKVWEISLGDGYAGPAVWQGRVFIMDYEKKTKSNSLRCFSLADGKEIWRRSYPIEIRDNHGMSRTVPAVDFATVPDPKPDDKNNTKSIGVVSAIGPKCTVITCNAETGEYLWGMDLVARYGTKVPDWYAGQCPIIDFEKVIIAPAGKKLMIAVEAHSGKVIWETENPENWKMSHSSIIPMEVISESGAATRVYIYMAFGGMIAGVDAETGKLLFTHKGLRIRTATVPTPVDLGEGRLFLSGGYGAGSMFMKIRYVGDKIVAEAGKQFPPSVFGTEQHTPVYCNEHIYGVLSKKAGEMSCRMTCLNIDGETVWTSGPDDTFGLGAYMIASGMIFAVNDDGVLTLAEARPEGWRRLARAKVLNGHESWAPMALVDGLLLLRDREKMVCLDMRAKE